MSSKAKDRLITGLVLGIAIGFMLGTAVNGFLFLGEWGPYD